MIKRSLPLFVTVPLVAVLLLGRGPILRWFLLTAPGGGRHAQDPSHAQPTMPAGPFQVGVATAEPAVQPGDNHLQISVSEHGAPLSGAAVTAEASMPAMGAMPEMRSSALITPGADGTYAGVLNLAMPGTWTLRIQISSADGRSGTASLPAATGSPIAVTAGAGDGIAYYTCSMHPSVHAATPGSCPICGMTLTPVSSQEADSGIIVADAERQQLIGVMTGHAERVAATLDIRAAGVVAYDEPLLQDLTLRYQGWIGQLFANALGMEITKGQALFTLYSPDLLAAQNEFLQGSGSDPGDRALREANRQRLELWGMAPEQISALERRKAAEAYVPILSPVSGVIIGKPVVAGSAVASGMTVLRIADLSQVWVEASLYESEQARVEVGTPVTVTVDAYPGARWTGTITFLYPYLDDQTRSTRARITVANADHRLKPGMYATAQLHVPLGPRLVVPEDAVIHAGETALVFIDLGGGRFKPQHVTTGIATGQGIEILTGLDAGDAVVTRATFLLAAESRLKSAAASW